MIKINFSGVDHFTVRSSHRILENIPYLLPEASTVLLQSPNGYILSQSQLLGDHYHFQLITIEITKATGINIDIAEDIMFMQYNLSDNNCIGNAISQAIENEENTYSIQYMPRGKYPVVLQIGRYVFLNTELFKNTLKSLEEAQEQIRIFQQKVNRNRQEMCTTKKMTITPSIWSVLKKIFKSRKTGHSLQIELTAAMSQLINLVDEDLGATDTSRSPKQLDVFNTIDAYLLQHLPDVQKTSVKALALYCNMSVSSFKRHFKEYFYCPAHTYVRNKRIEIAFDLLIQGDKTKAEIADCVGYANPGTTAPTFDDVKNKTPAGLNYLDAHNKAMATDLRFTPPNSSQGPDGIYISKFPYSPSLPPALNPEILLFKFKK